ncbi:BrnT family toxin [Microcystis aeruginosa]|uniref:BrnT family toxin n=1 Tax=Microcystis aeruginosa Ma_QC_C_20070703_M131 TaxID=2486263 RepID=A0A551XZJ7_MICAE|nr:BrnT family toxin [Microcystis aeruginosa]MDB9389822.1 BrnT family toxin [Microcystis aeruginosa CS-579]TRT54135.1 MAG: BrnT family toxin [Microcystis aeruginosa Ma_QC_C_20070703_M131]
MEIEWDNNKAAANLIKHKIDFEDAKNIFLDTNCLEREDKRDYNETIIQVIGIVNQVVLLVVYTKRNGRYRIISARRANKNERRQYYQSQT